MWPRYASQRVAAGMYAELSKIRKGQSHKAVGGITRGLRFLPVLHKADYILRQGRRIAELHAVETALLGAICIVQQTISAGDRLSTTVNTVRCWYILLQTVLLLLLAIGVGSGIRRQEWSIGSRVPQGQISPRVVSHSLSRL